MLLWQFFVINPAEKILIASNNKVDESSGQLNEELCICGRGLSERYNDECSNCGLRFSPSKSNKVRVRALSLRRYFTGPMDEETTLHLGTNRPSDTYRSGNS